MKFVTIRDFRARSAGIQRELPVEKEMILTSNGKPVAIIASVTDRNFEETLSLFRRARASLAINALQTASLKKFKRKVTLAEINAEIRASRKERRRR